jgi:hypothetical protein
MAKSFVLSCISQDDTLRIPTERRTELRCLGQAATQRTVICRDRSLRAVVPSAGLTVYPIVREARDKGSYPAAQRRKIMSYGSSTGLALAAALMVTIGGAHAADDTKYPNWKGQWSTILTRGVGGQNVRFDPTKAFGPAQQAPLTAEYQKVHEASMADQAKGGLGNYPTARCLPGGMPRMMTAAQEYVITPETTYIIIGGGEDHIRRVFTDGRDWPTDLEPTYQGYSIGKWSNPDADGRYTALEVETRGPFKGPRAYDATGSLSPSTISLSSRKGSIWTRTIRAFFMTKSP